MTTLDARPIRMKNRDLIQLRNGKGVSVQTRSGTLWITQSNDTRDIVVKAGESFVLDRPGLALVTAMTDATVTLCARLAKTPQLVPFKLALAKAL